MSEDLENRAVALTERINTSFDAISNEIRKSEKLLQPLLHPFKDFADHSYSQIIDENISIYWSNERIYCLLKREQLRPWPLIEMPINIRIKCAPYLNKFVENILNELERSFND